jgi:hypothetical protein
MGMTPKLHSIETLAVETGRDRRTVARALRNVTPDGTLRKRPAWRLQTAIRALDRRSGGGGANGATTVAGSDADGLIHLAKTIEEGFEHARKIKNIEERRAYLRELGPSVGQLDRGLASLYPNNEIMEKIVRDHITGGTISTFLGLMEMTLVTEQGAPA